MTHDIDRNTRRGVYRFLSPQGMVVMGNPRLGAMEARAVGSARVLL